MQPKRCCRPGKSSSLKNGVALRKGVVRVQGRTTQNYLSYTQGREEKVGGWRDGRKAASEKSRLQKASPEPGRVAGSAAPRTELSVLEVVRQDLSGSVKSTSHYLNSSLKVK